eukprot:m.54645 g.54645  ORF g.54645 m.54645 type:complete len:142 (+) comp11435_c0_seq2:306-731(+)
MNYDQALTLQVRHNAQHMHQLHHLSRSSCRSVLSYAKHSPTICLVHFHLQCQLFADLHKTALHTAIAGDQDLPGIEKRENCVGSACRLAWSHENIHTYRANSVFQPIRTNYQIETPPCKGWMRTPAMQTQASALTRACMHQ